MERPMGDTACRDNMQRIYQRDYGGGGQGAYLRSANFDHELYHTPHEKRRVKGLA